MTKEILGHKAPKKTCTDPKCPFHGQLNVKKELFRGFIVSTDSNHTAVIEWKRPHYVPKYERYEMRKSKLSVHNPPCLDAQVGQEVIVAKTRPLSKTKGHVILQITNTEIQKVVKEEAQPKEKKKSPEVSEGNEGDDKSPETEEKSTEEPTPVENSPEEIKEQ